MKLVALLIFWGMWYVSFSCRTIIAPIMPVIEDELTISHTLAGNVFLFLSLGYTVSLLLSGILSPRIGYKRSILSGFFVLMIAMFSLKFTHSYFYLIFIVIFMGLGAGVYLPSAIPLLTSIFRHDQWGRAIAFHETAASFSIFSIPIITGLMLHFFYWRNLFFLLALAIFVMGIAFWKFSPDIRPKRESTTGFLLVLRRKDFWNIAILWVFAASNGLGLYNMIPLFLVKEGGMALETANTIFGVSRIGGFLMAILSGFLVDLYGVKKILFFILVVTGISTVSLSIAPPGSILIVTLIIQATFSTGFFPVTLVAISKITEINERSSFTGATIAIGVIFGLGLTPFLLGVAADKWSFHAGIFILGLLTVLSCFLIGKIKNI
jgi:MFS transporter, NNP family, nitrate/nitrite transporter